MKTSLKMNTFLLIVLGLIALTNTQALAGHWDKCQTGSGETGLYTFGHVEGGQDHMCFDGYYQVTVGEGDGLPWPVAGCGVVTSRTAFTHLNCVPVASAHTQGTITRTLTWVPDYPGELPLEEMWLKKQAIATWRVFTYSSQGVSGLGMAGTSPAGAYRITRLPNINGYREIKGEAKSERWERVDTSSGLVSCELSLSALANGSINNVVNYYSDYAAVEVSASADCWLYPNAPLAQMTIPAPWEATYAPYWPIHPKYHPINGGAQTGGDPVNLATGAHAYLADSDITVYNPYGPAVVYERNFHSGRAAADYASPGLSTGWVDSYDVSLIASDPESWSTLQLTYPNGAVEYISPLVDEEPTGEFSEPPGAPYFVLGSAGANCQWQWIEITWKDQTKWRFEPAGAGIYRLTRIVNRTGRYISIIRDASKYYRVSSITDDSSTPVTLLTFSYDDDDHLVSIADCYDRKVTYAYGSSAGISGLLLSVSQLVHSEVSSPPTHFVYTYQALGSPLKPYLASVGSPNPHETGTSAQLINYDTSTGRVSSFSDANGNQQCFSYDYNNGTIIQIKDAVDTIQKQWTENFDPMNGNVSTGSTDAKGYCATLDYLDWDNPTLPTAMYDKTGQGTLLTYDSLGNTLTIKTRRGTTTTYSYNYPDSEGFNDQYPDSEYPTDFRLGRLMKIQEGSRTPTTFTYYEPSGLLHTVSTPKPGTTDGSTVTTSFTYDALGNILTKTTPGNNAASTITTTYNYLDDGDLHRDNPMMGQPITIADNLGHTTHFRYDERGNVTSVKDALGHQTDFTYNLADQPLAVIYPSITPPP